jgi:hypothetical protein
MTSINDFGDVLEKNQTHHMGLSHIGEETSFLLPLCVVYIHAIVRKMHICSPLLHTSQFTLDLALEN